MNYNPYFPGGAISMARVLYDGLVEFEDGELSPDLPLPFSLVVRNPCYYLPNGQGCRHLPELGSGT